MDTILTCTKLGHCKGCDRVVDQDEQSRRPPRATLETSTAAAGCKMVDALVGWLFHGVAVAFFESLQRCSCVIIDTRDEQLNDDSGNLMAASSDPCGDSTITVEIISTETSKM